jgi:hypothetical protein
MAGNTCFDRLLFESSTMIPRSFGMFFLKTYQTKQIMGCIFEEHNENVWINDGFNL